MSTSQVMPDNVRMHIVYPVVVFIAYVTFNFNCKILSKKFNIMSAFFVTEFPLARKYSILAEV